MYAEIPQEIIQTLDSLIQVDNTYVISKFRVNPAKACYKPFSAHLMIEFTEFTSIKLAENPPKTFPKYVYALTPFDKIVPAQGAVPILTGELLHVALMVLCQCIAADSYSMVSILFSDVLGYITKYTSATTITPKGKERASILREVFIKDMRYEKIKKTSNESSDIHQIMFPMYCKCDFTVVIYFLCAATMSSK